MPLLSRGQDALRAMREAIERTVEVDAARPFPQRRGRFAQRQNAAGHTRIAHHHCQRAVPGFGGVQRRNPVRFVADVELHGGCARDSRSNPLDIGKLSAGKNNPEPPPAELLGDCPPNSAGGAGHEGGLSVKWIQYPHPLSAASITTRLMYNEPHPQSALQLATRRRFNTCLVLLIPSGLAEAKFVVKQTLRHIPRGRPRNEAWRRIRTDG